ncbi:hypothetical protein N0V95_002321 [Ascochyta clinopodiicola]|nr:hypothetical protein N0V95_002321 [Ascochyta clinopodiicola]
MPLHLLGKKSWNVYNPANIARVRADEEAAAARDAAADQRMQDLDAERRAALLRGHTPPPLPEQSAAHSDRTRPGEGGHDRKRRKLAGEDDTDMDIRLAASMARTTHDDHTHTKLLKLRTPTSDAPLTDHAGNIDLFPVDVKETLKREKNADAEEQKRKRELAFEDQYTMRFSNAGGNNGLQEPWYAARQKTADSMDKATAPHNPSYFESKNVWGNEDPRRKEREQARISSNDPMAFMQKAQTQLKKSKQDKKKWSDERNRELRELRDAQEKDGRNNNHRRRSTHTRIAKAYHAVQADIKIGIATMDTHIVGHLHRGPTGVEALAAGHRETIRAYITYPENRSTQNAILIMTDVLGFEFPNVQLIADQFAANGYFTIIPDVFNGNTVPLNPGPDFDFPTWRATKMPREATVDPIYATIIKHLRGELGVKRLGGVGYCFGGKYVCRWLKEGGLDAGFTAHPSFVGVDELKGIKGPLSIAAAETDSIFPAEKRRETEDILKEMRVPYQMTLYSDVQHGFGVKGHLSHQRARFAKELAFLQAVFWFDEYVKKETHDTPIPDPTP